MCSLCAANFDEEKIQGQQGNRQNADFKLVAKLARGQQAARMPCVGGRVCRETNGGENTREAKKKKHKAGQTTDTAVSQRPPALGCTYIEGNEPEPRVGTPTDLHTLYIEVQRFFVTPHVFFLFYLFWFHTPSTTIA